MSHPDVILTDPVLLIILVLATARLTRLATTDTIFDTPRLHIARWDWSNKLIHCPFCIGFWITIATVLLTLTFPSSIAWLVALLILAISQVVGWISDP